MIALLVAFGAAFNAEAVDQGPYTCQVALVGPFFNRTAAYVKSTDFPDGIWVVLNKETEKALLATILTARSLGADVWCYIMGDSVNVSGTPMQTVSAICIVADADE
jgi:hypothetical protein